MSAEQQEVPQGCWFPEVEEKKKQAQEIFDYFDLDKSGSIDATEVENVVRKWVENRLLPGLTEEQIKEMVAKFFKLYDENADAKVSFDQIYNAVLKGEGVTLPRKLTPEEAEEYKKHAQELFDAYDNDKSGYIDATDLEKLYVKWREEIGTVLTPEEEAEQKGQIPVFMKRFDINADGKITFDEMFKVLLASLMCEI